MSQKNTSSRGRPRTFDEKAVLAAARDAFWAAGLDGVSLDQITAATGVARPSLALAFGDKKALYLRSVESFVADMTVAADLRLCGRAPLANELRAFYLAAIELYLAGEAPRGCLAICTLPAAAADADVRETLRGVLGATDAIFAARFQRAQSDGELAATVDLGARGALAASLLHSIALRARGGARKAALKRLVEEAIFLLVGAAPKQKGKQG
jgi:TetR/AcrR family transcriptional regulator, copper-responsive repressor